MNTDKPTETAAQGQNVRTKAEIKAPTQTASALHRVSRRLAVAGSPAIWANRLAKAISEREHYKSHADKLAEALADCLELGVGDWDGEEPSFIKKSRKALAAYEEAQS